MREPENGKRTYEQIEIPGELQETMNRAVRSVDKKKSAARYRKRRMMRTVRNIGVAAAAGMSQPVAMAAVMLACAATATASLHIAARAAFPNATDGPTDGATNDASDGTSTGTSTDTRLSDDHRRDRKAHKPTQRRIVTES